MLSFFLVLENQLYSIKQSRKTLFLIHPHILCNTNKSQQIISLIYQKTWGRAPRYLSTLLNLSYHFIGPPSISMNSIFQFLCSCIMTSSPFINLGSYIMYEQDEPKSHLYTLWVIPKFVVCVWSKDSIITHIRGVYKRGRDRGTVKKLRIIFFCRQR